MFIVYAILLEKKKMVMFEFRSFEFHLMLMLTFLGIKLHDILIDA